MLEPRKKKKKPRNKWAIVIPILLVLISSVWVFNGRVLSELGVERNIIINEGKPNQEIWKITEGESDKVLRTSGEIKFKVDLQIDYNNPALESKPNIDEIPFVVLNELTNEQITNVVADSSRPGIYEVTVPKEADGELKINLKILANDNWKTAESSFIFNVIKDSTDPKVSFNGVTNDTVYGDVSSGNPVMLDVQVIEKYTTPEYLKVSVKKDGKEIPVEESFEQNEDGYLDSFSFVDEGDYDVTVTAEDLTGGIDTKTISFSILNKAPTYTVLDENKVALTSNQETNTKKIDIQLSSKIIMNQVSLKIIKDETLIDTKVVSDHGKSISLEYLISKSGKYRIEPVVKHRSTDEYNLPPFEFIVDQDPPEVEVLGVLDDEKSNEGKSIVIKVKDYATTDFTISMKSNNGVKTDRIAVEDGTAFYEVTEEGEYPLNLKAGDKLGNESTKIVTFIIDKIPPTINIENISNNGFYKEINNGIVLIKDKTLDLEDLLLSNPLNTTIEVTKDNLDYEIGSGIWSHITENGMLEASRNLSFTEDGVYRFKVTSTDLSKNRIMTEPITFTIDSNDPDVFITNKDEIKDGKTPVAVKASVEDKNIDWDNTKLKIKRNNFEYSEITGKDVVKPEGNTFIKDGTYVVELESIDKAGNKKVDGPVSFTIDNTPPQMMIDGVINGEHYQKLENLELSIVDLTLKKIELNVKKDGELYELGDGKWDESLTEGRLKKAFRKLSFDKDGDYEISLTTSDMFGSKTLGPIKFTIDNTDPVIDLSGVDEGDFVQKGKSVKVRVKEHNFENNHVVISAKKDGKEYDFGDWKNSGEISELSHTFKGDGDYEIEVEAIDRAKNEAVKKTLRFTVDNTKPEIHILGPKQNSYHKTDKNVKITVEEHNFGNNKVDIKVTRKVEVDGKPIDYSIGEWNNIKEVSDLSHLFEDDGEYEITVNATDAAGNKGDTEKLLFTIDKTDPKVDLESQIENGQNYRTNMLIKMRAEDRNIDLSNTVLKVEKNGKAYNVGKLKLLGDSKTVAYNSYTFFEEGKYEINLKSTDKAGNSKRHDKLSFIIDKTNPVVKIDGTENNSFNPENKNVTISIDELNYETNNVSISATKDGASFPIGTWRNSGKLSKLGYNFTRDGLYTILATAEDKAGNGPITEKRTFTIDKTKPEIEITGVENNAYYNVDKPVNATIKDVNLDINRITVTRNGARYNASGFSVNGDLASFRHNFSGEGEYNILVEATDKAGNSFSKTMTFTIDKTKPVITPKFKGQNRVIKDGEYINEVFTPEFALDEAEDMIVSATLNNGANLGKNIPVAAREMKYTYKVLASDKAGNESTLEISFTLDTTKPALNISGVLDGFFNKNITPKVTYSDIHLDSSKTFVTLNGKPFENGAKLEYEQDYILKAVITDLAKNVSSRTIVFTIDKTKPVIKFKEPISNKYFNTDLLPQLLIDDMSSYDIIAMMLDGKPYEKGDPIKEEGKHVMFFEVKDKAGNIQQLSVEFIIDKTAPKVVYEGVKNKGKYYDPVDVAVRLDNPNDKIKSVMINGEMFDGDVIEENGFKVIKTKLAEIKSYEIKVIASDEAGNEKTTVISFEIVEKGALVKFYENKPLLGGTVAGLVGLIGAAATMMVRRRKLKVEEE
jgi:large repetitive protein